DAVERIPTVLEIEEAGHLPFRAGGEELAEQRRFVVEHVSPLRGERTQHQVHSHQLSRSSPLRMRRRWVRGTLPSSGERCASGAMWKRFGARAAWSATFTLSRVCSMKRCWLRTSVAFGFA